ncbi:hypothetical protein P7C70_g1841, partial [Phenoliferia sp. Uapishka_3]
MSITTATRRTPPAPSQRVSAGTVLTEPQTTISMSTETRQTPFLIASLALTSFAGSIVSLFIAHHSVTSFRSRLPASTMNASTIPSPLPYFSDKRNLLNVYFVKYGWAWTTGVVALYLFSTLSSPSPTFRQNRAIKIIRRYTIATAYWYILTQGTWFLGYGSGPALAHQILMYTGAECVPAHIESGQLLGTSESGMGKSPGEMLRAPGVCNPRNGEYWKGGHDVSGHTFMMVHAILLIVEVVGPSLAASLPTFLRDQRAGENWRETTTPIKWATRIAMGLVGLWWWMLLMTSVYFHTPSEKLSGFAFAVVGWSLSSL